jgi:hypothetical protein
VRFEFREGYLNAVASLDWLRGTPPVTCPATPDWKAEYFQGNNLEILRECRNETTGPNRDFGSGSGSTWTPVDGWSARWTNTRYFDAGSYDFAVGSDDGVRLYIDNVLVLSSWWGRGYTIDRLTRTLTAGMHTIRIEYFESGGPGRISYSVAPTPPPTTTTSTTTTTTTTTIPPSTCPTITGWKAEYFNGTNFNTIRRCRNETSSYPNFDWGTASPDPLVNSDNFSARWTRTMYFGAGPWDFVIGSGDGFRLYINGTLVSNSAWWTNREYTTNVITRNLTAGNHTIVIEFYESTGSARISASVTPGE